MSLATDAVRTFILGKSETNDNPRPLIITAKMDDSADTFFTNLRTQHFPPERNYLRAHITLFHAIPGDILHDVRKKLAAIASQQEIMTATVKGTRFLGNGVALSLECAALQDLHDRLSRYWSPHLTPQDRQKFSPHITIQNKVEADKAKTLFNDMTGTLDGMSFKLTGLGLWHYDGGPWEADDTYLFSAQR